ncbi:hypothetical protein [Methylobacterium oryzisoli]|uniref:hypothetical protein n=1 Tax=Methylobacterium oryzisoli TaxID=3385502 RepID=UPI003891E3CC
MQIPMEKGRWWFVSATPGHEAALGVFAVLIWQRIQVHRAKQTCERSPFTDTRSGEPRFQVGIERTQMEAQKHP